MKHTQKHALPFVFVYVLFGLAAILFTLSYTIVTKYAYQFPCANSITCAGDLTGAYDPQKLAGTFHGKQVIAPQFSLADISSRVLGDTTGSNKHIYIDLTNQRLSAYEGDRLVYSFLVSTGLWGRTPTGDFRIWIKLRYTRMSGGNKAIGTYYDLPNVPYTMFFYNDQVPKRSGYGLHGTYWHNNFGHPMSHGCVNMKTEEVALLYAWVHPETKGNLTYATTEDPGTLITIYGTAPTN